MYIEGFLVPVPASNKDTYRDMSAHVAPWFKEFGVLRHVEAWGDDVPDGKLTDFRRAVAAEAGEEVVFSWFEYPSREVRDSANQKIMSDPRMEAMDGPMPFDGKRMVIGGFEVVSDEGQGRGGYIDGSLAAVPKNKREEAEAQLGQVSRILGEMGALRLVRAWSDDVQDGKVTDFRRAVAAQPDEDVVFMWIEWPDRAARDAGWGKAMSDPRMTPPAEGPAFDGRRQIFGGFATIFDE
jgi:uncharacterized protein YbaA (DUF1428 family)